VRRLLGRREFLILTPQLITRELEAKPTARWAQREQIDQRLSNLEHLLVTKGPNNPKVRFKIGTEADCIEQTINPSELRQLACLSQLGSSVAGKSFRISGRI
jgi:hypothetical protein